MTKIVRASLGLPTLRAGPQFQNSKPVLVIWYWNLIFCNAPPLRGQPKAGSSGPDFYWTKVSTSILWPSVRMVTAPL